VEILLVETMKTDVLIIGGGSAGSMAAIRAKEINPKQRVTIFEKSDIKYGGSIPRGMDALNIVTVPGVSTVEQFIESARIGREGIVDDNVSYAIASRSWDLLKKLESWGVCFPKYENGHYEVLKTHSKGAFTVTMQEPNLKTILYEKVKALDCEVFNRTMVLELLVDNGRVAGAVGMNVRNGNLLLCQANAVVLAGGGAARFGLPDNGHLYGVYDCPANTGDAYSLAFKAGAELTGLECTASYVIVKDINCPLLHITLTRGAILLNALEKELNYGKDSLLKAMVGEHYQKGLGYLHIRMSHLPEEKIKAVEEILFTTERPVLERFFKGRGVDFRTSDIELGPTEFYLCGGHGITGVKINEKAASSIPGLYAAGDTAHGQAYLTGAFVLGELAAENATEEGKHNKCDMTAKYGQYIEKLQDKISKWEDSYGKVSIEEFEFKVRRMINNFVVPPKNEYKLKRALEVMEQLQDELSSEVKIDAIHDLVKAFEVESIITCAKLSAKAALERKESRWGYWHYRSDYPETNEQYTKHIVVKKGEKDNDILTYFKDPQRMFIDGRD